jgi:hypothetical protein
MNEEDQRDEWGRIDTKMGKVGCLGKGAGKKSDLLQNCASISYK